MTPSGMRAKEARVGPGIDSLPRYNSIDAAARFGTADILAAPAAPITNTYTDPPAPGPTGRPLQKYSSLVELKNQTIPTVQLGGGGSTLNNYKSAANLKTEPDEHSGTAARDVLVHNAYQNLPLATITPHRKDSAPVLKSLYMRSAEQAKKHRHSVQVEPREQMSLLGDRGAGKLHADGSALPGLSANRRADELMRFEPN